MAGNLKLAQAWAADGMLPNLQDGESVWDREDVSKAQPDPSLPCFLTVALNTLCEF